MLQGTNQSAMIIPSRSTLSKVRTFDKVDRYGMIVALWLVPDSIKPIYL